MSSKWHNVSLFLVLQDFLLRCFGPFLFQKLLDGFDLPDGCPLEGGRVHLGVRVQTALAAFFAAQPLHRGRALERTAQGVNSLQQFFRVCHLCARVAPISETVAQVVESVSKVLLW